MPFCTKCGHKNGDENRFCEECGTQLQTTNALSLNQSSQDSPAAPIRAGTAQATGSVDARNAVLTGKITSYTLIAVGLLATISVGAYLALRAEPPSSELFASLISKTITDNPDMYKSRYCISNFSYEKDPVYVYPSDSTSIKWLSVPIHRT